MADLETAKDRLVEVLRDRTARYWELMKSWYKRKIAKEDFDTKAKNLLGDNNLHLHNEFLFAILVKCQTGLQPPSTERHSMTVNESIVQQPPTPTPPVHQPLTITPPIPHPPPPPPTIAATSLPPLHTTASKPHPKRQRLVSPPLEPVPYGLLDPLQYLSPAKVQIVTSDLDTLLLCSNELLLPDNATLHTRILLGAWEAGLDGVHQDTVEILQLALEVHLKNVLQTLVAHTTTWQTRKNGHFQHSFGTSSSGCGLPRPRHDPITSTEEMIDLVPECRYEGDRREAVTAMIAGQQHNAVTTTIDSSQPITLFNVRDALTLNKSSIPIHPIYSCSMERVLAGMWHADVEEEKQRLEVQQWQRNRAPLQPLTITDNNT